MSGTIIVSLPGNERLGGQLADALGVSQAQLELRQFPDGETYLRLKTVCEDKDVVVVSTLDRPDAKLLPLIFLCDLLRDLGARKRILIAPYLAYMRQDKRFNPGEALTSASFAHLLSGSIEGLLTVDPHLHRRHGLDEIYSIPARVVHAAPMLAEWIRSNVSNPLLVGPDSESEQWVADVAARAGSPYIVLEKTRRGDRAVEISVPDVERWRHHRPILVDDIISTAHTMIETVRHLHTIGMPAPVCLGVHAVFAGDAVAALRATSVEQIVTTDTIPHETNGMEISNLLIDGLEELLSEEAGG